MKAALIEKTGGPEVIQYGDLPITAHHKFHHQ